jgi:two-component system, chemotaxis family, chemotaxis protein CheY
MLTNLLLPILVVDDNKSITGVLAALLNKIGFKDVDQVHDGVSALQRIIERKYGLVISDWQMEPVTGHDLLQAIRKEESLAKTPFIMITGDPDIKKVIRARKSGVNGYITKPFDVDTLRSKIEEALAD